MAEAAVIGVPHPKWQERPLLVVVLRSGRSATREELLAHLSDQVAKWWLPNDVVFVDELPHTATGWCSSSSSASSITTIGCPSDARCAP